MLWAVPGVPLQCPSPPSLTEGHCRQGSWDRQRCKRIATQAAGGAPLQGGPAGSGAARNACRCDAVGCAKGCLCSAPPTQPHCRDTAVRVGGTGSAAERIATQAAGGAPLQGGPAGSGAARNACRCDAAGLCQGCLCSAPPTCSLTVGTLQEGCGTAQRCPTAHCYAVSRSEGRRCRGVRQAAVRPGSAWHGVTAVGTVPGAPWSCRCLPDPPAAAPLTEGHCVAMRCGTALRCPTTLLQCPSREAAGGWGTAEAPPGTAQQHHTDQGIPGRTAACRTPLQRRPSCGLRSNALCSAACPTNPH